MDAQLAVITTPLRAVMAVLLIAWLLASRVRSLFIPPKTSWGWMFSGMIPAWAVVIVNVAFWGVLVWVAVTFVLLPLRKDEKIVLSATMVSALLAPVSALLPGLSSSIQLLKTLSLAIAFLAAVAVALSFRKLRENQDHRL